MITNHKKKYITLTALVMLTALSLFASKNSEQPTNSSSSSSTTQNQTQINTTQKKFKCSFCLALFDQSKDRNKHEAVCRKELKKNLMGIMPEKPFKCSFCKKTFAKKPDRNKHERTHTGEKPFRCSFCGESFTDVSNRNKHQKTCNINSCKPTSDSNNNAQENILYLDFNNLPATGIQESQQIVNTHNNQTQAFNHHTPSPMPQTQVGSTQNEQFVGQQQCFCMPTKNIPNNIIQPSQPVLTPEEQQQILLWYYYYLLAMSQNQTNQNQETPTQDGLSDENSYVLLQNQEPVQQTDNDQPKSPGNPLESNVSPLDKNIDSEPSPTSLDFIVQNEPQLDPQYNINDFFAEQ